MKAHFTRNSLALLTALCCAGLACSPARAYRPFDGTDAGVAEAGEFELEFGPIGRLQDGDGRSWLAPAIVGNWGLSGDRELVLEAKGQTMDGDLAPGAARTNLVDAALSLKQLHKRGVLQGEAGVSVASECAILLPGVNADAGLGASCAGIVSQRLGSITMHLNAELAYKRDHKWAPFLGVIVEGPSLHEVRPVAEVFVEHEAGESNTVSALAGLIWKHSENMSFDTGIRHTHGSNQNINELRIGLTWTTSLAD